MLLRRRIALGLGVGLLTVISGFPVLAQESQGGSGLSISPTRTELSIEPGKSEVIKVSIKNVSGTDIIAKVSINDFESDNESGEPRLISDPNKQNPASIRNLLTGVNDITLAKDEKKDLEYGVQVPPQAAPGAYYGVIRFTAIPSNQQVDPGQVALTASVGSLVLIEVPGDIREQIQVRSIKVTQDGKGGSFFLKPPNLVNTEIKNTGNSFSKPFGRVTVAKAGGKEVHSFELNNTDPKSNILPNSTRVFKDNLYNVTSPGRYTVTANISHGKGGEVITYRSSFWYVPTWVLAIIAILLAAVIIGALVIYKRRFSAGGGRGKRRR